MVNIDWRIHLAGGVIILIGGGVAIKYALDIWSAGEDLNQIGILALLAVWGGCDWILKGIQEKK